MAIMLDVLLDALLESLEVLGVLVVLNVLISLAEGKAAELLFRKKKYTLPVAVGLAVLPQCGFSLLATDLYQKRKLTAGTLIGVYIATSDEALPILIANPDKALAILPLIAIKVLLGVGAALLIDLIFGNKLDSFKPENKEEETAAPLNSKGKPTEETDKKEENTAEGEIIEEEKKETEAREEKVEKTDTTEENTEGKDTAAEKTDATDDIDKNPEEIAIPEEKEAKTEAVKPDENAEEVTTSGKDAAVTGESTEEPNPEAKEASKEKSEALAERAPEMVERESENGKTCEPHEEVCEEVGTSGEHHSHDEEHNEEEEHHHGGHNHEEDCGHHHDEHDHEEEEATAIGCCKHHLGSKEPAGKKDVLKAYILHPFIHSLKIFAYVLAINIIFGVIIYFVGEENFMSFLETNKYIAPFFAVLVGVIPNCAASVILTELFVGGGIGFGACIGGLTANAGLGLVLLFKKSKDFNKNLIILGLLLGIAIIVGYAVSAVEWLAF